MYIIWMCHSNVRANEMMILIVVGLTTTEKVSRKSNISCLWNPFTRSLAFYLLIMPSRFSLTLKTILHLITFLRDNSLVNINVPFIKSEFYRKETNIIALNHSGYAKACLVMFGLECTRATLGLELLVLTLVNMEWLLVGNVMV